MPNEQDFTNREIQSMFGALKSQLEEHGQTHEKILSAVKETNGKVANIQAWRERVNGGSVVAVAFMSAIVIPILVWAVYTLSNLDRTINESIQKALSVYEIPS